MPCASLFQESKPVWSVLTQLGDWLNQELSQCEAQPGQRLADARQFPGAVLEGKVFLGEGTVVHPGAVIQGPAWIGAHCVIRPGCYIRGQVIVGDHTILGNSSEFKNAVLGSHCEVPHFNYVGDSILGPRVHLAAGVILSNFRLDRKTVTVPSKKGAIDTGLRKFGAVLGEGTEIGCQSVLSPGSLIGKRCLIYPGVMWRGRLGNDQVVKLRQQLEIVERRAESSSNSAFPPSVE